jgi:hypothetical protein
MEYLSDIRDFPCARNRIRFRVAPGATCQPRKQRAGSASLRRNSSIGCRNFSRVASRLPSAESKGGSSASEIVLNPALTY